MQVQGEGTVIRVNPAGDLFAAGKAWFVEEVAHQTCISSARN